MVDLCKIMMSVGFFLLFSKFWVVKGGWGGWGGENWGGGGKRAHFFKYFIFCFVGGGELKNKK